MAMSRLRFGGENPRSSFNMSSLMDNLYSSTSPQSSDASFSSGKPSNCNSEEQLCSSPSDYGYGSGTIPTQFMSPDSIPKCRPLYSEPFDAFNRRLKSAFQPPNGYIHSPNESVDPNDTIHSVKSNRSFERRINRTTLPARCLDEQKRIVYNISQVVDEELVEVFAKDKSGCHFLQENFPVSLEDVMRSKIYQFVFETEGVFESMCKDVFANFFIQHLIEKAGKPEQERIYTCLYNQMYSLCLNRYACRVVQKAIETLNSDLKGLLLLELHDVDLVRLATDQNANHVIQKMMQLCSLQNWSFVVSSMLSEDVLFNIVEDKYGCRVVQLALEKLCETHRVNENMTVRNLRDRLRSGLMDILVKHCERFSSNEFANYVIQHVFKMQGLEKHRDTIINKCLLRNLLSLSQEKFASHVVEKAMEFASPVLLHEMMDEIFDGYVPHPETHKDALDILLFHQYGNYVVQRMLAICVDAELNAQKGVKSDDGMQHYLREWLIRLRSRIEKNRCRLEGYSSGKKILEKLGELSPRTTRSRHHQSNFNDSHYQRQPQPRYYNHH